MNSIEVLIAFLEDKGYYDIIEMMSEAYNKDENFRSRVLEINRRPHSEDIFLTVSSRIHFLLNKFSVGISVKDDMTLFDLFRKYSKVEK